MKTTILFGFTFLAAAGALLAADSSPKDDVVSATKKLEQKQNYSWTSTVVVPDDAPFKPGPTVGKAEKDGYTLATLSMMDNKMEIVTKGDKGATVDPQGNWKLFTELEKEEGPGPFIAMFGRSVKTPVKEAAQLASFARELKKDGDAYGSELTEAGAKTMQWLGPAGGEESAVKNAKGSVKFWLKDGELIKYEFKLKGLIHFGDNEFPNERTTTVEIKDVGTTKLVMPEGAQKKVS